MESNITLPVHASGVKPSDIRYILRRQSSLGTAPNIFGRGNDLQMVGVDTASIPTEMVQVLAIRDQSAMALVYEAMRTRGPASGELDHPVAFAVNTSLPVPASCVVVNDVLNRRQTAVVSQPVLDELSAKDSDAWGAARRARNGLSATTHAHTRGIGRRQLNVFGIFGMHFDDSSRESWGATPSAVRAARGLIAA